MKTCTCCLIEKPRDDFYQRNNRKGIKILRESTCKECTNLKHKKRKEAWTPEQKARNYENQRKWTENNPERNRINVRRSDLKNKYDLSLAEFSKMEESQNGLCAICFLPETNKTLILSVDHCHQTGKVRGLLCRSCNIAIGLLKDSSSSLENAIAYLKRANET